MNKEIKAIWVKALRSDEYRQTTGGLRDECGFCCLGVLCELHRLETKLSDWYEVGSEAPIAFYHGSGGYLPDTVVEWAGLDRMNPIVMNCSLGRLNDDRRPFTEIADLIDKYL